MLQPTHFLHCLYMPCCNLFVLRLDLDDLAYKYDIIAIFSVAIYVHKMLLLPG